MLKALVDAVMPAAKPIVEHFFPDKEKAAEFTHQLRMAFLSLDSTALKGAISIILAEANSQSWLARNWRPLTMLTFVGMICAHWFGFTPANLTEAERLAIYRLVELGLGGYVFCRSAEKIAPGIVDLVAKKLGAKNEA